MAMESVARPLVHRRSFGWLKTSVIVLVLIAVGLIAAKVSDSPALPLSAVAVPPWRAADSTMSDAKAMRDKQLAITDQHVRAPDASASVPRSAPRECKPDQGILDDCTFE